ncbi:phosphoribosylformylglycinamidine synthase subunit PurQ [Haliscomenobacter sp.]|uniref:phosphoribosylformylglycinamidine synthase subunit PurQ n=1 Tax=Haliscomenobacter sp. TaxID=2717303 RepID=UPI0033651CC6
MKFGIIVFPGSNCDDDMLHVLGNVMQQETVKIWHKETELDGFAPGDCIVLPGGFSYGDYLRSGAIARFSPIMNAVVDFANSGGLVYGICNGFQILCEAGLLPGVLLRNANQQYICKNVFLKTISNNSPLTAGIPSGQVLKIPIAHGDGRFYTDAETLAELEANDQILFKYCMPNGEIATEANPNGAVDNIAGICNKQRNVFGMMPHPERAAEDILGNADGHRLFDSLVKMTHMSAAM